MRRSLGETYFYSSLTSYFGAGRVLTPTEDDPVLVQPGTIEHFVLIEDEFTSREGLNPSVPSNSSVVRHLRLAPARSWRRRHSPSNYAYALDARGRGAFQRLELGGMGKYRRYAPRTEGENAQPNL